MRETSSRQVNMQVLLYKEIIIECSILVLSKWFLSPIYSQRSPLERCKKFGAVGFDFVTVIALFPKLPSLTILRVEVSLELLLQAYLTCKNQTVIQRHLDSFSVGYTYIWPMLIILTHVELNSSSVRSFDRTSNSRVLKTWWYFILPFLGLNSFGPISTYCNILNLQTYNSTLLLDLSKYIIR